MNVPVARQRPLLVLTFVMTAFLVSCIDSPPEEGPPPAVDVDVAVDTFYVSFETEQDIVDFFVEVNYSPEAWAAGVREVPRLFVTEVGARWGERANTDLTVLAKKQIFFRGMAPLALRSNELIRAERERLLALPTPQEMGIEDREWLAALAEDYGLSAPATDGAADSATGSPEVWNALMAELRVRVDEVPVSLVLAQAANESGWGTSRFAHQGNALFGQWTFGGSGMLPEAQRKSLGDYRVAAFESPLLSVIAYMRNLNTHPSYARLRDRRAEARAAGLPLIGYDLARGLDRYSERGQDYVDDLHNMIDVNRLREADFTYLAPGPVYLMFPPDRIPRPGTDG